MFKTIISANESQKSPFNTSNIALLMLINIVIALAEIFIVNNVLEIPSNYNSDIFSKAILFPLLRMLLIIPLLEGLIYRLWLEDSKVNFIISFSACIAEILYGSMRVGTEDRIFYLSILFITMGIIFFNRFLSMKGIRYDKYMLIISAALFASLHISHFGNLQSIPPYYIALLAIPPFILGLITGSIRLKYGFKYSVIFHSINCGIIAGLTFIYLHLGFLD